MTMRLSVSIEGIVQGVGFRPFVFRLASQRRLNGFVLNTPNGVRLDIEGRENEITGFLQDLKNSYPPTAKIDRISTEKLPLKGYNSFNILQSQTGEMPSTFISPDLSICDKCRDELFSKTDRRRGYPFINCTQCGPRYTIIEDLPYDRIKTTMRNFDMCDNCRAEYNDPSNRRFHAEPNACPECGPEVTLLEISTRDKTLSGQEAIIKSRDILKKGGILALKGLGGFHLACDASCDKAILRLRDKKTRERKPFALMAKDINTIREVCHVSVSEESLLLSPEKPIVLMKRILNSKGTHRISDHAAGTAGYLGFMLPYTPLHHLLFDADDSIQPSILIMTSGNMCDEPIVHTNEEAVRKIRPITSYFLIHDRDIHMHCDDSVAAIFMEKPYMIRRARGHAPNPLRIPFELKSPILACGADLKNTFALGKGRHAFISPYIGDLRIAETERVFENTIEHYKKMFSLEPKIIACDQHPDYASSRFAERLTDADKNIRLLKIQHHHAHIASCMSENGLDDRAVIGVALDGAGFGEDNTVWGGEFLIATYRDYSRRGHLIQTPMPGGDMAAREPWRMAYSYLYSILGDDINRLDLPISDKISSEAGIIIRSMIDKRLNTPMTSSMGRFFDAVSSILGICHVNNFEGQAAMELEYTTMDSVRTEDSYPYAIFVKNGMFILDPAGTLKAILSDLSSGVSRTIISSKFHNTVAEMIVEECNLIKKEAGIRQAVLSGGVFQNMILLDRTVKRLTSEGFEVFTHSIVPANDGGISLGQISIAGSWN